MPMVSTIFLQYTGSTENFTKEEGGASGWMQRIVVLRVMENLWWIRHGVDCMFWALSGL